MGLDMFLEKRRYLSVYNDNDKLLIKKLNRAFGIRTKNQDFWVKEVTIRAGYWRKVNSIHNWFVQNVQKGVDECQSSPVSDIQLQELYDTVCKALKTKNAKLLEPRSGFFFGSTNIDDYYWEDLKYTKKILKKELDFIEKSRKNKEYWDYYYQSSW